LIRVKFGKGYRDADLLSLWVVLNLGRVVAGFGSLAGVGGGDFEFAGVGEGLAGAEGGDEVVDLGDVAGGT
jgi:hypothetical protein